MAKAFNLSLNRKGGQPEVLQGDCGGKATTSGENSVLTPVPMGKPDIWDRAMVHPNPNRLLTSLVYRER